MKIRQEYMNFDLEEGKKKGLLKIIGNYTDVDGFELFIWTV